METLPLLFLIAWGTSRSSKLFPNERPDLPSAVITPCRQRKKCIPPQALPGIILPHAGTQVWPCVCTVTWAAYYCKNTYTERCLSGPKLVKPHPRHTQQLTSSSMADPYARHQSYILNDEQGSLVIGRRLFLTFPWL